jgi:hypothetical protein
MISERNKAVPSCKQVCNRILNGETLDEIARSYGIGTGKIREIIVGVKDREELFAESKAARKRNLINKKKNYWIKHNPLGWLTILGMERRSHNLYVDCKCVCGKHVYTSLSRIIAGSCLSCGCIRPASKEVATHRKRIFELSKDAP